MGKAVDLLRHTISLPFTGIFYTVTALVCVFVSTNYIDILHGLQKAESIGEINLRALAGWLVIIFLPHIINGILLDRCNRIRIFSCVRTKSVSQYNISVYMTCLMNSCLWGVILWVIHLLVSRVHVFALLFVLVTHIIMWTSVMLLIYALTNGAAVAFVAAPLICVLSIGFSCSNNSISDYMISCFGMLTRGSLYNGSGLPPMVQTILNLVISVVCISLAYIKDGLYGGKRKWKPS